MLLQAGAHGVYAYTGGRRPDPAQPVVIFIHGAQNDHSVWILQSRYLAHHGFGVLAIDLPGHGRSSGAAGESVEAYAESLAATLRHTGLRRLLLVGHSMGSLIALELARRLPQEVAGVALLATAFPMRVSAELLDATRSDPAAAMEMINVWSFAASIAPFAAWPSNPGPGFNLVWQNLRLMQRIALRNGADVLARDFAACDRYRGGLQAAAALHCPALFVLGQADQMTPPKAAQGLIDAVRQAQVVRLPRVGHAIMGEAPDAVRSALLEFARARFAATPAPAPDPA